MGTKNNPGDFDCYTNAEPDEPMFILLARDPLAPFLVALWVYFRSGDPLKALNMFNHMVQNQALNYTFKRTSEAKLDEANKCAEDMRKWHEANRKN